MKKKRIIGIFVIVLVIIEITSIFLMYKSGTNRKTILDTVKLNEIEKNNTFAIMIEQDGEYIESETFPTDGYILNETISGCIDGNGNTLSNVLTYKNGVLTVKTRTNASCYLYFDIEPAADYLVNNVSSDILWKSTLEDDGYRYIGTDPANYVCFGYSDASTDCDFTNTTNSDLYSYRIIGIFEDSSGEQHLKLIKKEALNETYQWHNNSNNDIHWNESDLYSGLNGSYFLTNTTYSYMQDTNWTNKIATWNYTLTSTLTYDDSGINYYTESAKNIYLHEMNRSTKTTTLGDWQNFNSKIGLMYVSDYQLSLGEEALEYVNNNYTHQQLLKLGWVHISNNDSETPSQYEWTMTRNGANTTPYTVWFLYLEGYTGPATMNGLNSVRPVFYLTSDVSISGEGTSTNPYIIS